MGDVIKLRQARKQKKRSEKAKVAAANRAAFGRTKAEKAGAKAESERAGRALDGARRSRPEDRDER
jgi:hypothetical protein